MDMQITQATKRDEWVEVAPGVMQAVRFETACGMVLYESGRSRLLALLHAAYELHNAHVAVSVDGGEARQVALTDAMVRDEHLRMLGDVDLGIAQCMSIEQIDERTFRLTEVLEEWMGEPKTRLLRIDHRDPSADDRP